MYVVNREMDNSLKWFLFNIVSGKITIHNIFNVTQDIFYSLLHYANRLINLTFFDQSSLATAQCFPG